MKLTRRLLALVLSLLMVFTCVGAASASETTPPSESETASAEKPAFRSADFEQKNAYKYAQNEKVRAIVILEKDPLVDINANSKSRSAAYSTNSMYKAQLKQERHKVENAIQQKVNIKVLREFDTLLNGFSCEVAYGDLEAIAKIPGVKSVHIANVYTVPDTNPQKPTMSEANLITGNAAVHEKGITGKNIVIAVLDTGTKLEHEAFQVYEGVLGDDLLKPNVLGKVETKGQYISEKIPFAYDYADGDNDVTDKNGHGTHVAGIALGYARSAESEDGGYDVVFEGAAPGAQLLAMKIFSDGSSGTYDDIYFQALEDALKLGADVVNMSIGSPGGFTYDDSLEGVYGDIYGRLEKAGVVVCVAGGNEYSMAKYSTSRYIGPEYTDYGTIANPAAFNGNVSVASAENSAYPAHLLYVGTESFRYNDNCEDGEHGWLKNFGDKEVEYVVLKDADGGIAFGTPEDFAATEVKGKIAVVSRGGFTFEEKVENAAKAGAIGCIVANNDQNAAANFGMAIETYEIPAVLVPYSARDILLNGSGTLSTPVEAEIIGSESAGLMSDFSNWGTSPDLTISPAISSVGGMVYSADYANDEGYTIMSGTSMACPNMAGTFACVLSYLRDKGEVKEDAAEIARALLESTADFVYEGDALYSVRKQGAGMGNAANAIKAYENGAFVTEPLVELKDGLGNSFEVKFKLRNDTDKAVTYTTETVVMTDKLVQLNQYIVGNSLTTYKLNPTISCPANVTVPAYGGKTVVAKVTLSDTDVQYLSNFENGAFLEGYVTLKSTGTADVHATFLGYYGDWTKAPALEEYDFRVYASLDNELNIDYPQYIADGYTAYNFLPGLLVTDFNTAALGKVVDGSPRLKLYAGDNLIDYAYYNEAHIAVSTSEADGDWLYADTLYMLPYQRRNVKSLTMTIKNAEDGTIIYMQDSADYVPKSSYNQNTGAWETYVLCEYQGTDENGKPLPSGTKVTVTFDAVLPYKDAEQTGCWTFDVTIDSKAPVIESAVFDEEAGTVTVTVTDDQYLAGIYLADAYGEILAAEVFSEDETGLTYKAEFDVNEYVGVYDVLQVGAIDYATNERMGTVNLFAEGEQATITLVSPAGSKNVITKTGETYTFTACTDEVAEGADFMFWNSIPVEDHVDAEGWGIYSYLDDFYFDGDEMLVTGDCTFYAIYLVGTYEELDMPLYSCDERTDYTGDWAIVGQPYYNKGYRYDDPYALNADPAALSIKTLVEAGTADLTDSDENQFYTSEKSVKYTFKKLSDGSYSIKNASIGKYLACVDGALAMVSSSSAKSARWNIEKAAGMPPSVLMTNVADASKVLMFDDVNGNQFVVMDKETALKGAADHAYRLMLYAYAEKVLVPEYWTSDVPLKEDEIPVIPPDIQKPVEKEPEKEETPPAPVNPFVDVKADDWFYDAVLWAAEQGITAGHGSDDHFAPTVACTRGQTVMFLWRAAGCPDPTSSENPFVDVDPSAYYYKAVLWAIEKGITTGATDTTFCPDNIVSRGQTMTFLYRFVGSPSVGSGNVFTDIPGDAYYKDAVQWAVEHAVTTGTTDTTFSPNSPCTRAQIVAFLFRGLK